MISSPMRSKIAAAFAAAALCFSAASAGAIEFKVTDELADAVIARTSARTDYQKLAESQWRLTPEKNRIFADHIRELTTSRDFIRYLLEQGQQAGLFDSNDPEEIRKAAVPLTFALMQSLGVKGFARLSPADQRTIVRYNRLQVENAPNGRVCRAMQLGTDDATAGEVHQASRELMLLLPAGFLKSYLAAFRRAVAAEIRDDPPVRSLTPTQRELAEKAVERAVEKELDGKPARELGRLLIALDDIEGAPPDDFCSGVKLIYRSYDGLSGVLGEWARADLFLKNRGEP